MTNGYFYNILNAKGYVLVHGMLQQVASAADAQKEIVALQLFWQNCPRHGKVYLIDLDLTRMEPTIYFYIILLLDKKYNRSKRACPRFGHLYKCAP